MTFQNVCNTRLWALEFAKAGFPVFPLEPRSKTPYRGSRGFKDALLNSEKVEQAFEGEHNLGVATGRLCVIDVDPKNGGDVKFSELLGDGLPLRSPVWVRTGSGGEHHYFLAPKDVVVPCRNGLWKGIDLKAMGGYVVGPGSMHENGQVYEMHGDLLDTPELPICVLDALRAVGAESAPFEVDAQGNALISEGSRNQSVFKMLSSMRARGFDFQAIMAAAQALNETQVTPPLPSWEINLLAKQATKYKPGEIPVFEELTQETQKMLVKASELWDLFEETLTTNKLRSGVPTGIPGLDEMLAGGLKRKEITVVSAVAKSGKTTLINNQIANLLKAGEPCAFASREMDPATQVLPSLLHAYYGKDAHTVLKESGKELRELVRDMPLWFSSGYGVFPLDTCRAWAESAVAKGIHCLFLDHFSFCLPGQQDHTEADGYIRGLKSIAMELDVSIVVVVQPTKLAGNTIGLETLKGGSSIGQTLDNLVCLEKHLLSREDCFPSGDTNSKWKTKDNKITDIPEDLNFRALRLDRTRNPYCETGTVILKWEKATNRFRLAEKGEDVAAYTALYDSVSAASLQEARGPVITQRGGAR